MDGELEPGIGIGDTVTVGRNRLVHVRRERADALTAVKRQRFLDVVAATANVKRGAAAAGAAPASFYRLRHRSASFAAAWDRAVRDGYAALEAKLLARALSEDGQEPGDGDRGDAIDPSAPFDPRLALDVLKRDDARSRGPSTYARASGYRFMPMEEVERSLLAKLDALERRLAAAGEGPTVGPRDGAVRS